MPKFDTLDINMTVTKAVNSRYLAKTNVHDDILVLIDRQSGSRYDITQCKEQYFFNYLYTNGVFIAADIDAQKIFIYGSSSIYSLLYDKGSGLFAKIDETLLRNFQLVKVPTTKAINNLNLLFSS